MYLTTRLLIIAQYCTGWWWMLPCTGDALHKHGRYVHINNNNLLEKISVITVYCQCFQLILYLSLSRFKFRLPMILHPVFLDLFSFSPYYPISSYFPANLMRYLNKVLLLLKPSYIQPRFSCKHVCNRLYG